jgi:hypothetical protein
VAVALRTLVQAVLVEMVAAALVELAVLALELLEQ